MSAEASRLDPSGCCQPPSAATPETISNRPGLSEIGYRIGRFGTFRQAMIQGLSRSAALRDLTTRASDDFGIGLIDLAAYVGDVETFYQERIANEAYLRTAVRHATVLRFASALGYRPGAGVAAETYLALTLEDEKDAEIPSGLKVQSVPEPGETPQKFETVESLAAHASWNAIRPLQSETTTFEKKTSSLCLAGVETGLKPGDGLLLVGPKRSGSSPTAAQSDDWDFCVLAEVDEDVEGNRTIVRWKGSLEGTGAAEQPDPTADPPEPPEVYAFDHRAGLFGQTAPAWPSLPEEMRESYCVSLIGEPELIPVRGAEAVRSKLNWADDAVVAEKIRDAVEAATTTGDFTEIEKVKTALSDSLKNEPDWPGFALLDTGLIELDAAYEDLLAGSWVMLEQTGKYEPYRAGDVVLASDLRFLLNGTSIRVTPRGRNLAAFDRRRAVAHIVSRKLEVADRPIEGPVSGSRIDVEAFEPVLTRGQRLIITGFAVGTDGTVSESTSSECALIDHVISGDEFSTLVLQESLQNRYDREEMLIQANVVQATHGVTIADEVLGDGDPSKSFQRFALKKSPVTFVSDAAASSGAASTLEIRVDEVEWTETSALLGHGAEDRVFVSSVDADGTMSVQFGDGATGSRLPAGRRNVVATYRQGVGTEGNIEAKQLRTLLDRPAGLKGATNPAASSGGSAAETLEEARTNAPNTVRTFERVVSLRDFEDAAREYAGVSKARATTVWCSQQLAVRLVVAGDDGETLDGDPLEKVRCYLDARRDPHRLLQVRPHRSAPIRLAVTIQADPAYEEEAVEVAATTVLLEHFDFENRDLGQPVHLSDLYAALASVPGVAASAITDLAHEGAAAALNPGDVPWHLNVPTDGIASLTAAALDITMGEVAT